MNESIRKDLRAALEKAGVTDAVSFSTPPNPEMGDLAFACFPLAKSWGKNPAEIASELAEKIAIPEDKMTRAFSDVKAVGPYVNFTLNHWRLLQELGGHEDKQEPYGQHDFGKGKKILVEFACPNPMKAFHIGHLRNTMTGESVCRILENVGYEVVRINYQGDVGRHIGMSLYGIDLLKDEFVAIADKSPKERVEFLGKAYAAGAQAFEKSDEAKAAVQAYNKKVYAKDSSIEPIYSTARQWSLDYFDTIYEKLDTRFDQLYFESQIFEAGTELAKEFLEKGVFKKSDGAVIFEGSKHGLHDRVFLTSKGLPTYEAKDLGLAQAHFADHHPDRVCHVVGKEQAEYFKVVFKALEEVVPESAGKEEHVVGGFVQLKGDVKMSSRKGNVVTGDRLIEMVEEKVAEVMKDSDLPDKDEVIHKVAMGALKYSMLKVGVSEDVPFDLEESVSVTGDSGPYLQYVVARIRGIYEKAGLDIEQGMTGVYIEEISPAEKQLLLQLAKFEDVTKLAAETRDPAKIAKYLFDLAQKFNTFYHECPVLSLGDEERELKAWRFLMVYLSFRFFLKGFSLLGFPVVSRM